MPRGYPDTKTCPDCKEGWPADFNFCPNCGADMYKRPKKQTKPWSYLTLKANSAMAKKESNKSH